MAAHELITGAEHGVHAFHATDAEDIGQIEQRDGATVYRAGHAEQHFDSSSPQPERDNDGLGDVYHPRTRRSFDVPPAGSPGSTLRSTHYWTVSQQGAASLDLSLYKQYSYHQLQVRAVAAASA
eukprot:SAG11_NODE_3698_length_2273_cov_1.855106_3_plen_124_part_00